VSQPETRYARSGGIHVAFQVLGDGPVDLVFVPGFISNMETQWEDAGYAHLCHRLAAFSRLILFDKRGSGLSDRVGDMPDLETRMDDVRAVLDAAGSRRAVLMGASEGGPMSILFAATYPERTQALILYGAYAHFHSWVLGPQGLEAFVALAEDRWGEGATLPYFCPTLAEDARFRAWWAKFERMSASPAAAIALARMNGPIDVRGVLPAVRVPTLVLHRADDARVQAAAGRYLARHVSSARYVELPGVDHPIWVGDTDRVVDEIEEFLTGTRPPAATDRVLATVLHVDLARPTHAGGHAPPWPERLQALREWLAAALLHHRGRTVGSRPDGITATFDGPVRALRCALAAREAATSCDVALHAGIHTGEVEVSGAEVSGGALHVAARIAAVARPGEVLASAVVRDIVPGCGLAFRDGGARLPGTDLALLALEGDAAAGRAGLAALTARERDILGALADGLSNARIATDRGLSEHTVKRHVANILDKLDLPNRTAAAAFAAGRTSPVPDMRR
jgi:pimeloyl-ACP methyl ester carboxylesterase/DNA-binding CsgD family transcriptional regulator